MPLLIRKLGLAGKASSHEEESWARRQMIEGVLSFLGRTGQSDPVFAEDTKALQSYYERELRTLGDPASPEERTARGETERRRQLGRELRAIERGILLRLRDDDKIHDEVLRVLEREIDLLDARFAPL
jgi:CPA1 family monovalent cation:H+ antiporter